MTSENTKTDTSPETVNLLWTGGWDSTFRLIQLARAGRTVQPYYIINPNRPSTNIEISTMTQIRKDLNERYSDCHIHNINYTELSTIYPQAKFIDAHARLTADRYMGTQYTYISALAEIVDDLEMSLHEDDISKYYADMIKNAGPDEKLEDERLLFGRLKFPILNFTKLSMKTDAEEHNDIDILNKSWFCHNPINRRACGLCNPCKYSLQEGMQHRFTKLALFYSRIPFIIKPIRRVARYFF